MDWYSWTGNFASIAGLIVGVFTFFYAKSASEAAQAARKGVRRANAGEAFSKLGDTANRLLASMEHDQHQEALLRAGDLVSDVSRYKLRYDRFLDAGSKARFDEAREQISVISRFLATRGAPGSPAEKNRLLKICHDDVVVVLNEESAKIIAAIEKEDE
jgi:hypothetical protein